VDKLFDGGRQFAWCRCRDGEGLSPPHKVSTTLLTLSRVPSRLPEALQELLLK